MDGFLVPIVTVIRFQEVFLLLIGLNWVLAALVSRQISSKLLSNKWSVIFVSAILMVLIVDVIIEPLSGNLDFWYWEMSTIPLS